MSFNPDLETDKDMIRAYLGDTESLWLQDEQIDAVLNGPDGAGIPFDQALVILGQQLLARMAQMPLKGTVDGKDFDYTGRDKIVTQLVTEAQARVLALIPATGESGRGVRVGRIAAGLDYRVR